MNRHDPRDLSALARGTPRQQRAYAAIQSLNLFHLLRVYSPTLAGTIPLGIDLPTSDLDIICQAHGLAAFERCVRAAFGARANFHARRKIVRGVESFIANFDYADFPFEIFAQPRAVSEQYAVRHLLIEARVLEIGGEPAREKICALRAQGLKTEPTFAALLGLAGDPYEELLQIETWSDEKIAEAIRRASNL
ncbi:MAG: DUF4269 domain-containing protein [Chloroflexi bacterium]|nr:DUF4269 domain-containing protein [Chloroflexota bacterium]